jgi:hypothetical protein
LRVLRMLEPDIVFLHTDRVGSSVSTVRPIEDTAELSAAFRELPVKLVDGFGNGMTHCGCRSGDQLPSHGATKREALAHEEPSKGLPRSNDRGETPGI